MASSSPRRKELLGEIVCKFETKTAIGKEVSDKKLPSELVMNLAAQKAGAVMEGETGDCVVIGADTVVVLDKKVMGKPADAAQARQMLSALSGREHCVLTGVCILSKERMDNFFVRSDVLFHELEAAQIDKYVKTGSPFDKAGAYGIQDSGFVKEITGSYSNVMGLPLEKLKKHLEIFLEEA